MLIPQQENLGAKIALTHPAVFFICRRVLLPLFSLFPLVHGHIREVSKAKRMYKMSPKHPNSQTLTGYVDRLVAINVNPVTIDKKWGFEHIETPMY